MSDRPVGHGTSGRSRASRMMRLAMPGHLRPGTVQGQGSERVLLCCRPFTSCCFVCLMDGERWQVCLMISSGEHLGDLGSHHTVSVIYHCSSGSPCPPTDAAQLSP